MSADYSNEESGLINTVELAVDWHLPITDEMFNEYTRLINRGQQSKQNGGQQSGET